MKKRGLSDIVATVMIILLALAAVAIIWYFIQPLITNTGRTASLSAQCLQTEAKPTKCVINTTSNTSRVIVQLTDEGASKVNALLEDNAGITILGTEVIAPSILSTTPVDISNTGALNTIGVVEAKAIAIVQDDEGNTQLCNPSTFTFTCTKIS